MKIVEQLPEYIRTLIPYEPGKPIEEVEREYGIAHSTKLASNENPLGPSPKALAAIRAKLGELNLYPDGDCYYLKNGLAKKAWRSAGAVDLWQRLQRDYRIGRARLYAAGGPGGHGAPGVCRLPADHSSSRR